MTFLRFVAVALLATVLSACAGNVNPSIPNAGSPAVSGSAIHPNATMTVFPTRLIIRGIGAAHAKHFAVSEAGYTGSFSTTETEGCIQAATLSPSFGNGPKAKYTLTGVKKMSRCSIKFTDTKKHSATLKFSVL